MNCKRDGCPNTLGTEDEIFCGSTCYNLYHRIDPTKCLQCQFPIGNAQEQWAEAGVCTQICYNQYYSTHKTDEENNIVIEDPKPDKNKPHLYQPTKPYSGCELCGFGPGSALHNTHEVRKYEKELNPDVMEQLTQGIGTRADKGKSRVDLIPADALLELGDLYRLGAEKYNARNWEHGMAYSRMYGSMMRHMLKFWEGEEMDPDGFHHLTAVAFGALGLLHYELSPDEYKGFDDRWFGPHQQPMEATDKDIEDLAHLGRAMDVIKYSSPLTPEERTCLESSIGIKSEKTDRELDFLARWKEDNVTFTQEDWAKFEQHLRTRFDMQDFDINEALTGMLYQFAPSERRGGSERRVKDSRPSIGSPIWARRTGNDRRKQNG